MSSVCTEQWHNSTKREDQQDATIRCLLLTSISTCFGHHYAHLQENKGPVTVFGVLFWFCWMWLVVVVGRCVVGSEQRSHPTTQRLAATGNRKLHHIYVLDQCGGSLQLAATGKKEVTSHIYTKSTQRMSTGCHRKQVTTTYTLQTECWISGGGVTCTVASDVNVRSQVSSPANEHQMAAALARNTTRAAGSATFSWLTPVKQQQAAQWCHHSYSRHLAALPNCLSVRHEMFCSTTLILATRSVSTWCMS